MTTITTATASLTTTSTAATATTTTTAVTATSLPAASRSTIIVTTVTAVTATTTMTITTTAPPVDCVGQYHDLACYGGLSATFFNVSAEASGGGLACPVMDVSVQNCSQVPVGLNWSYAVPREDWGAATRATHAGEIPPLVCPLGSRVSFAWSGATHDVWRLPGEDSYNLCDFSAPGAARVSNASSGSTFLFDCAGVGTHYFACSVDGACGSGGQKVRIYVSDPARTVRLRARGGVSLEQFNIRFTLHFAGYFLNHQSLANASADGAIRAAQSVLAHSPESCSDWIPAPWNSNQSCQAFIYTDLGFISRAGPSPDFNASEAYYMQALQISPGMCGATSYMAELRVQMGMRTEADEWYARSCEACGEHSLDFHDLRFAYERRSWALPPSCAGTNTSSPATATTDTTTTTAPALELNNDVSLGAVLQAGGLLPVVLALMHGLRAD